MPSFIPATGITLHLVGVCVNRIGVVLSSPITELKTLNVKQYFPPWALKNGKPFRIELPIYTDALMVSRCANLLTKHNVPKKDAEGKYWAIYKS